MKNKPTGTKRAPREVPLDHLRPGGRHPSTGDVDHSRAVSSDLGTSPARPAAAPAEPTTPGGESGATRGRATGSPAATATREHLEGSEQGPM